MGKGPPVKKGPKKNKAKTKRSKAEKREKRATVSKAKFEIREQRRLRKVAKAALKAHQQAEKVAAGGQDAAILEVTVPRKKKQRLTPADFGKKQELRAQLASLPAAEQAAWLSKEFGECTKASALETGVISGDSMRTLPRRGSLEDKLIAIEPDWQQFYCGHSMTEAVPHGAPTLLFVCASAVQANAMMKRLTLFRKAARMAKLFAKHIKIEQQKEMLESNVIHIAVGSPNRLQKLADLGALDMQRLRLICLDVSLDVKDRTIFDVPETRGDWWAFFSKHCLVRIADQSARIALIDGWKHPTLEDLQ